MSERGEKMIIPSLRSENPLFVNLHVDTTELDKALEKAEKLVKLLEQAQKLQRATGEDIGNAARDVLASAT